MAFVRWYIIYKTDLWRNSENCMQNRFENIEKHNEIQDSLTSK